MASPNVLLRRRRREYLAKRTSARLRAYLIVKARLGIFDSRMCRYFGVSPKVNRGCRKAICRAYAAGLVPTSTTGGLHSPNSFHGQRNARGEGMAVDFGLCRGLIGTSKGQARLAIFQRKEHWRHRRGRLGADLVELIGPTNALIVLRDHETDLGEGTALETQHDDHVHEAYRG